MYIIHYILLYLYKARTIECTCTRNNVVRIILFVDLSETFFEAAFRTAKTFVPNTHDLLKSQLGAQCISVSHRIEVSAASSHVFCYDWQGPEPDSSGPGEDPETRCWRSTHSGTATSDTGNGTCDPPTGLFASFLSISIFTSISVLLPFNPGKPSGVSLVSFLRRPFSRNDRTQNKRIGALNLPPSYQKIARVVKLIATRRVGSAVVLYLRDYRSVVFSDGDSSPRSNRTVSDFFLLGSWRTIALKMFSIKTQESR
ncbi:hypothetical protein BJ165DRAFT_349818 [Panaeolus papilionaceus]|nr:hypothetical protein BJ165DRAFT_349818 [Panaeolus papilionaceus]